MTNPRPQDIFHLPFQITEFGPDMVLALNRNFKEVERMLAHLQLYEKTIGKPINELVTDSQPTWDEAGNIRDYIVNYGERKVFKQDLAPEPGVDAFEWDLWLKYEGSPLEPVWRQLRRTGEGVYEWIVVAHRGEIPAEHSVITTLGLDAAVVVTGYLSADRIDAATISVGKLTATARNLINNHTVTNNLSSWASVAGTPITWAIVDAHGRNRVVNLRTSGDSLVQSDMFRVDPTQTYKCTMGMYSGAAAGSRYYGLYFYDINGNLINGVPFTVSTRTFGSATNNIYFRIIAGDMGTWIDMEAYLLAHTMTADEVPPGKNVTMHARMPANAAYARIRYLNYYNAGTETDSYWYSPSVVPVDGAGIHATSITTGTLHADRIGANSIVAGKLNVTDLSAITGNFTELIAGTPAGARLEMGASGTPAIPYFRTYDSNSHMRIRITPTALQFLRGSTGGTLIGQIQSVLIDEEARVEIRAEDSGTVYIFSGAYVGGNIRVTQHMEFGADLTTNYITALGSTFRFRKKRGTDTDDIWGLNVDNDLTVYRETVFNQNVGIDATPSCKLDIGGDTLRLRTARTPASAGAAGNTGDFCWNSTYFYICVATNTWRRVAHASW